MSCNSSKTLIISINTHEVNANARLLDTKILNVCYLPFGETWCICDLGAKKAFSEWLHK